jgi:hypothetical protein
MAPDDPIDDLRTLQKLIRREPDSSQRPVTTVRLDPDDELGESISLDADESRLIARLRITLLAELRFEHLEKTVEGDLDQFTREAYTDREADAVEAFLERHARDVEERICFVPVEHLKVSAEREVFGLRLLPIDHEEIPDPHPFFTLEPPVGSVAAVLVEGTHLGRMADRAQAKTEQSLRALRVAMRGHRMVPNPQLRFRVADNYSFGYRLSGWEMRPDVGWEIELDDELVSVAEREPVARLVATPSTDVDRRAQIALRWLADAAMEGDDVKRLLYLTFALEAVLGDRSEGLKAHALAFRRAVLSSLVSEDETFTHPNRIVTVYERARSSAVHGEEIPAVDSKAVDAFAWDVRQALNEVLVFVEREDLAKRKDVRRALEHSPAAKKLEEWIREHAFDKVWGKYLDQRGAKD